MKRLMWFAQEVLHDLENWCDASTVRDRKTVADRFEHEGVEFLTLTLPMYGKALERGLADGRFPPSLSSVFHYKGALPVFLSGLLELVFDRGTGELLEVPSSTAIWAVRQFTLMFAKIVPPNDAKQRRRAAAAIDKYLECETDVHETIKAIDPASWDQYARIGSLLWAGLLTDVESKLHAVPSGIIPRHGPGNTADRLFGNEKWRQNEWTERLEQVFAASEHLVSSWRFASDLPDGLQFREPGAERPVRVITVPKTYKTPRIIAIEPTCMQFMQQGLLAAFVESVEARDTARRLVGWASPVFNHRLAYQGSRYGSSATLDLSEASDRVSYQHVRVLLRRHGLLAEAVDSCRTRKADVPDHGLIDLAKFASMGSALTFPLESLVFMTVIFCGIENALSSQLTQKSVRSFLGEVRCYGDDIIVPTAFVSSVVEALNLHGFKVNADKSFWTGKFRESCGREYYDGTDVSIVRVRRMFPRNRQQGSELVSTIALRNLLYQAGLWRATRFIDSLLHGIKIPMPRVEPTSPVQGRWSYLGYEVQAADPDTFAPLVKGVMVRTTKPASKLDGAAALLKVLTQKQALTHTGRGESHASFLGSACRADHSRGLGDGVNLDTSGVLRDDPMEDGSVALMRRHLSSHVGSTRGDLCLDGGHGRESVGEPNRDPSGSPVQQWTSVVPGSDRDWTLSRLDSGPSTQQRCIICNADEGARLDDVFLGMLIGETPTVDVEHLDYAGRPRKVSTTLRYGSPW